MSKIPASGKKRILVRAPNWIGDQILAFPFYHFLRKANPGAHIAVACVSWVGDVQFRNLVDEVHLLPKPMDSSLRAKFSAVEEGARILRASGPWDLGISLPNSISAAWLLYRAGACRRRGYKVDGRGLLLNEGLYWNPTAERHRAQAYVDILPEEARSRKSILDFWGIPPENELDPWIPGELAEFDAAAAWPDVEPLTPPDEPYWVLAPGATADSRRWSVESFRDLADRIHRQTGWRGLIVGGPAEAVLADRLCHERRGGLSDWTARGPVTSLWKVFKHAKFTVCNESGLAHVASLCGSPVQIVCGAADPKRTRPLGPGRVQVAINPVECWPCERNTCSQAGALKFQCLRGIQAESIWEEIQRGIRP